MNNWDLYERVEARDFDGLKKKLKKLYDTFPVTVMHWGQSSIGTPYVIIKADRPIGEKTGEAAKPEVVDSTPVTAKRPTRLSSTD